MRVTELMDVWTGLLAWGTVMADFETYRPRATFRAVRPVPKMSYATPKRGSKSFQLGTFFTSAKLRARTHPFGVAGTLCGGLYPLK